MKRERRKAAFIKAPALVFALALLFSATAFAGEVSGDVTGSENAADTGRDEGTVSGDGQTEPEEAASPKVNITIIKPEGWWNRKNAKVRIEVKDIAETGRFKIDTVKAAVGTSGSYMDVTSEMYIEISENTTVYVRVTDSEGNIYAASKYIECYDKTKPTLNAAVNNGLLTVQATDNDSGVKAIYVNQYEFTDMVNGVISIRMKKYDANYEFFTVQALDNAGNMSEVYRVRNPYYKNNSVRNTTTSGNKTDAGNGTSKKDTINPASTLPASVTPTPVTETPSGDVVEHVATDEDGDVIDKGSKKSDRAKEFYTITTKSGKEFYLVVDRTGEKETTYFLTGITDNDLLNVTGITADDLPENAAYDSTDDPYIVGLPNNSFEDPGVEEKEEKGSILDSVSVDLPTEEEAEEPEADKKEEKGGFNPLKYWYFLPFIAGSVMYILNRRKKKAEETGDDYDEDEYLDEYSEEEAENESPGEEADDYYPEPAERADEKDNPEPVEKAEKEDEPEREEAEYLPESGGEAEEEEFPDDIPGIDNEEEPDYSNEERSNIDDKEREGREEDING